MIESMKPGAVIVDLAAERGGNTDLTKADQDVVHNGVLILGPTNLAGEVPVNASSLYAKNLLAFLETLSTRRRRP
jgi:NAD(P) transhydrogenase subunit alpha